MDDLSAAFFRLNQQRKRRVHLFVCHSALLVWEAYAQQQPSLEYVDTVIGLHHRVDFTLPRDALASVEANSDLAAVAHRYHEPIVALQDGDLAMPPHVELGYYAIYNLYRKYVQGVAIGDWLIVNQALSAEEDPARWSTLLTDALRQAEG